MNCNNISKINITIIGYTLFVALYFCRSLLDIDSHIWLDITKTLPVLFLSITTYISGVNKLLPTALLLSALGDLAGEEGMFLWQISLFAAAHIFFIIYFIGRAKNSKQSQILATIWAIVIVFFGCFVIGNIENTIFKYACTAYMVIIGIMVGSTMFIESRFRWYYIFAALLFAFSDSCIAWNKFVEHFSYAGITIMSTYFAAQGIFATLYLKEE